MTGAINVPLDALDHRHGELRRDALLVTVCGGTERSYNALRLAGSLARRPGEEVKVFLMGDAASCAKSGQKVPQGYYNLKTMLHGPATRHGVEVGVCGTCMDARGITEAELTAGATRGSLSQLTDWTVWADKTLVF